MTLALRAMRTAEHAPRGKAKIPVAVQRLTRPQVEDLIGSLIDLLDAMDGDADAEPSLGSIDATAQSDFTDQERWSCGGGQDREAGDDNGIVGDAAAAEQGYRGYGLVL